MMATLMGLDTISPKELQRLLPGGAVSVIDVNSPLSWTTAHVPGAVNLDPVAYDAGALPSDKNALLVFYCSNMLCRKAPNAARRANAMGYTNVRVMSAGLKGWLGANLPIESGR